MNKTQEEILSEIIGYNDRGIVTCWTSLFDRHTRCYCNNCGWKTNNLDSQFGHHNCPKPNGEYIRNDITPKRVRQIFKKLIKEDRASLIKQIEEMKLDGKYEQISCPDGIVGCLVMHYSKNKVLTQEEKAHNNAINQVLALLKGKE